MNNSYPPSDVRAWLAQLYGDQQRLVLTPETYTAQMGGLAAGASSTRQIQITANADFIALSLMFFSTDPTVAQKLLLTDSSSGEQFTNSAVLVQNYCNVAGVNLTQQNLPYPRYLGGNTAVNVQLTNVSAGATTSNAVSLLGFLVRSLG